MAMAQAHFTRARHEDISLAGLVLGTIERRYGLLTSEESVRVAEVLNRSGDLAVADRLAYVYAGREHAQVVVFEHDGWYYVGALDRHLTLDQAAAVRAIAESPRLLSLVTERGIAPVVSPLA